MHPRHLLTNFTLVLIGVCCAMLPTTIASADSGVRVESESHGPRLVAAAETAPASSEQTGGSHQGNAGTADASDSHDADTKHDEHAAPPVTSGIVGSIMTLLMLTLLQAVLGFDNLLYISIESKRVAEHQQQRVRQIGIVIAIVLRIVLLFVVMKAIELFEAPFFSLPKSLSRYVTGEFNVESVVVLIGGAFIVYTAIKEIMHMLAVHDIGHAADSKPRSMATAVFWIVIMNLVFSFDSILSAMALTRVFWVMASAIVLSGIMMIVLADQVSTFLKKNRMYEVLGLFILFIVGIMLLSEGGHKAHLSFFTHHVEAMPKSTFYFVLVVLVLIDIVQGRYQQKLLAEREAAEHATPHA